MLKESLKKNPFDYKQHKLLGDVYGLEGNNKFAIVEYRQAEKGVEKEPMAYEIKLRKSLAEVLEKEGNVKEALEELLLISKLETKSSDVFAKIGKIYLRNKNPEKAINYMRLAVEMDPSRKDCYYDLGKMLYQMSRFLEASQEFLHCIKIDRENLDAHYHLGACYRQLLDYKEAINFYAIAEKKRELRANAFLDKGICYLQLGRANKAKEEFLKSIQHNKEHNPVKLYAHYHVANLLEESGEVIKAIAHWEAINEMDASFKDVPAKLKTYSDLRKSDLLKDFATCSKGDFQVMVARVISSMGDVVEENKSASNDEVICVVKGGSRSVMGTKGSSKYVIFDRSNTNITDDDVRASLDAAKRNHCVGVIYYTISAITPNAQQYMRERPVDIVSGKELNRILQEAYKDV